MGTLLCGDKNIKPTSSFEGYRTKMITDKVQTHCYQVEDLESQITNRTDNP